MRCSIITPIVGSALLVLGGIMIPVVNKIVHNTILKSVVLANNTLFYKYWKDVPFPIYMQFYFFDLLNRDEVLNGERPAVSQKGPYTYRETRQKYDIEYHDNGTVSYRQRKSYHFERSMSVGDEEDEFLTTNPLFLALTQSMQYQTAFVQASIYNLLTSFGEDVFVLKTVHEMIWEYNDTLLGMANRFAPEWFSSTNPAFFANLNNSDDGVYTVFTGQSDINLLGVIDKYNGETSVPYWTTKYARMINGTDGCLHAPFIDKASMLYLFSSDICRSVPGIYHKDVYTPQGIELYRFSSSPSMLANATVQPDNRGFCTPLDKCLGAGLLNVSSCKLVDSFHLPGVISFPHFYMADPKYIDAVDGMDPRPEYTTDIDIEPYTGAVLQVAKRLQFNLYIKPISDVESLKYIREIFMPVFWINESAVVDDDTVDQLRSQLFTPLLAAYIIEFGLITVGALLLLLASGYFLRRRVVENRSKHIQFIRADDDAPLINDVINR